MRLDLIIIFTRTFFLIQFVYFDRGHREEDPPDPIPNSEVKLLIADDTAERWESRSLRAFFCLFQSARKSLADFFCLKSFVLHLAVPFVYSQIIKHQKERNKKFVELLAHNRR